MSGILELAGTFLLAVFLFFIIGFCLIAAANWMRRPTPIERTPSALRRELLRLPPEIANEIAQHYLESNAEDQAGMMSFIECDGPRKIRELAVKHHDGTPTSEDLKRWVEGA